MSLLWFQAQALSSLSVYLPSYPVTYLLWYMFVKTACNGHKVHGYSCVLQAKSFELVHKSCYVSTCFFLFCEDKHNLFLTSTAYSLDGLV